MSWLSWLHTDTALKIAAALSAVAMAVKAATPPNTLAHKAADAVISAAATLGISSTVSRESK